MDAQAVVKTDLDFICGNLQEELSQMAGKNVLMTGGAGFLGYYMVQALLRWNQGVAKNERIHVTVMDNFIRGVPQWMAGHTGENMSLIHI